MPHKAGQLCPNPPGKKGMYRIGKTSGKCRKERSDKGTNNRVGGSPHGVYRGKQIYQSYGKSGALFYLNENKKKVYVSRKHHGKVEKTY